MKTNGFGHHNKGQANGTTALSGEPQTNSEVASVVLCPITFKGMGAESVKTKIKASERLFRSS